MSGILTVPVGKPSAFADALAEGRHPVPCRITTFVNGNLLVELDAKPPDDLDIVCHVGLGVGRLIEELALVTDALWRANPRTSSRVILPYLPYSRSTTPILGAGLGAAALLRLFDAMPTVERYVVLEPHSPDVVGFAGHPMEALSIGTDLIRWMRSCPGDGPSPVLVAPDRGRAKQVFELADSLDMDAEVLMKRRTDHSDSAVTVEGSRPLVQGRRALIIDDELTTGQTLAGAVQTLRRNGAERVDALVHRSFATEDTIAELVSSLRPGQLATTALTEAGAAEVFSRRGLPVVPLPHTVAHLQETASSDWGSTP